MVAGESTRKPVGNRCSLCAAIIAGGLLGAGTGLLIADSAILGDQGWLGQMLASGAISLVVLVLVDRGIHWFADGPRGRLRVAWGPVLGGTLGGIVWLCQSQTGTGILPGNLGSLPQNLGWGSYVILGSMAGLFLFVFIHSEKPLALGAAVGFVTGAWVGGLGDWSSPLLSISALTGVLIVLPAIRIFGIAGNIRSDLVGPVELLGTVLVGAAVGSLICGLATLVEPRLPSFEQATWLRGLLAWFVAIPNDIANLLTLPSGWLGGAGAGALLALFWSNRLVELWDGPLLLTPLAVIGGVLIGVFNWLTGGAIFAGLLGTWAAGALTGSLLFAGILISIERNGRRKRARRMTCACLVLGAGVGAATGGLEVCCGAGRVLAVISGAVAGMAAAAVAVETYEPVTTEVQKYSRCKPGVVVLIVLIGMALLPVFRAESAFCHLVAGELYSFSNHRRAIVEMTNAAQWNAHLDRPYETREKCNRRLNRYFQALEDLNLLVERNPRSGKWYLRRGCAHHELGCYDAALKDFTQAIDLAGNSAEALVQRGWVHCRMKRCDLAIEDFSASLALDNRQGTAYSGRGTSYRGMGQYQKALRDFTQAIEIDPHESQVWAGRGWTYLDLDDPQGAVHDFDQAIQLDPGCASAHVGRGDAYFESCHYPEALKDYDEAIRLEPFQSDTYIRRGNAYRKLGEQAHAEAEYATAAALTKAAEAHNQGPK